MEETKSNLKSITETTLIPLGLVLLIVMGVKYVSGIQFQADATAAQVRILEQKIDAINEIKIKLEVMESKIDRIEKKLR